MDQERNGAVFEAYRDAWRLRRQTGDTSEEVLIAALRDRDAPSRFSDPISPEYEVLFDLWRRGVSPRWLPVTGLTQLLGQVLTPWLEALRNGEESLAWMDLPPGKRALSEGAGEIALRGLEFRRADNAEDALSDCRDAPLDQSGWHQAVVWLQMDATEALAEVMVGDRRVGRASIPPVDWLNLREAAAHGLYSDGLLQVGRMENGMQAVGSLHCFVLA